MSVPRTRREANRISHLELIAPSRLAHFRRVEQLRPLSEAERETRDLFIRIRHQRAERQRANGTYPKGRAHGA
ncbi:hypothetical protein [Croceicoccus mobilis]|uniref:Uncharacterized protein n=1 Tax=Croceicoccus mobilis TaxID=1703339 RepID=A0A917DW26_9SPHN|nr:hypothetical protein [Croceicoccus mobilis]GGD74082.1 hypothetical protein GCM10010990_24650 [Croceicoccus mobilis]